MANNDPYGQYQIVKNYILNSKALYGTQGWATYANTPGTTPTTGTGGTAASITFTQSTTSALANGTSFVLSKTGAANPQGEGASYDFTIDTASASKVLQVSFDYLCAAGTFTAGSSGVDSSIVVYLYDVTNAVLIQPSTYKLYANSATVSAQFVGSFQANYNSTSYRLIFHCGTTATTTFDLKIDNVTVAPTVYTYGTPITDWTSYTPTFSNFGTCTNVSFKWRRVGTNVEISGTATSGTPAASLATITMPYSYTVNTTLITANTAVGPLVTNHSGSVAANCLVTTTSGNLIYFSIVGDAGGSLNADNGNSLVTTTDNFSVFASVPITGWSSSLQISDSVVWDDDVGAVQAFAVSSSTPPNGYLYADGSAVSRTVYSDLYAKIGTAFGSGDGSTTFNLPDYRGMLLRGLINIPAVTGTGTAASNNATFNSHGLRTGMRVRMTSGALSGLSTGTNYWAIRIDANTLAFATTQALATAASPTKITLSGANSAVIQQWMDPDSTSRVAAQTGGNTGANIGSHQDDQFNSHSHRSKILANAVAGSLAGVARPDGTYAADTATPGTSTQNEAYGGNQTNSINSYVNYFIKYVRGVSPNIAAADTVAASYWLSANFASSTTVPINFDSKDYDYQGNVQTSATAWKFTAPISGLYQVNILATPAIATGGTYLRLYKNGTWTKYVAYALNATGYQQAASTINIRLVAGDYIDFRSYPAMTWGGSATQGADNYSYVQIQRIGNY